MTKIEILLCFHFMPHISFSFSTTRLNLPSLQEPINDSYITLLMEFGKELEVTMRCYQKQKNDPPIGRNMPPIAGNFYLSFLFLYFSFPHTFVFSFPIYFYVSLFILLFSQPFTFPLFLPLTTLSFNYYPLFLFLPCMS